MHIFLIWSFLKLICSYLLFDLIHNLEKEMATHSSTLAWKIPWTEEPDRLQSMGSQRVGHNWVTSLHLIHNPVNALQNSQGLGSLWPTCITFIWGLFFNLASSIKTKSRNSNSCPGLFLLRMHSSLSHILEVWQN